MSGRFGDASRYKALRERAELSVEMSCAEPEEQTRAGALDLVRELQLHRVELELQNQQLRSAERSLAEQIEHLRLVERALELSRAQYRALFDLAPVAYMSLDTGGFIDRSNRAAEVLLGVAHDRLFRRALADFTQGLDLRALRAHLRAAAQGQHTCEVSLRRQDGSRIDALLESRSAPGGGCWTVLTDISARKRLEEALSEANRKLLDSTAELASRNRALEEALAAQAASDAERNQLATRLRDAERLEGLGLLAGGIAPDFRVLAHADLVLETLPDPPEANPPLPGHTTRRER